MPVFAVIYRYTDEHARRQDVRPIHREFLTSLEGALLCAGPFGPEEAAGALLLFQASSADHVLALIEMDPFRVRDLVASVEVRHWQPSLGMLATHMPVS